MKIGPKAANLDLQLGPLRFKVVTIRLIIQEVDTVEACACFLQPSQISPQFNQVKTFGNAQNWKQGNLKTVGEGVPC